MTTRRRPTKTPAGFVTLEAYAYTFEVNQPWGDDPVTATVRIERFESTGEYHVQNIEMENGSFSNWGWFQRECRADTLTEIRDQIQSFLDRNDEQIAEGKIRDAEERAARAAYDIELDAWTEEQLLRVELIPVEELHDAAAVIHHHEPHTAFAVEGVYNDGFYDQSAADRKGGGFTDYRVYDDGTWHSSDRAFNRYVKAGARVRGIREFTRPRPERP